MNGTPPEVKLASRRAFLGGVLALALTPLVSRQQRPLSAPRGTPVADTTRFHIPAPGVTPRLAMRIERVYLGVPTADGRISWKVAPADATPA